ncbi:hypothetical protein PENTCL1PPCAC_20821, partial [Pristionchus entomophagus]
NMRPIVACILLLMATLIGSWSVAKTRRELRKQLEKASEAVGYEYMKVEGFAVPGLLHRFKVDNVDEKSGRIEASVNLSYVFVNPFLRWDPDVVSNITQIEMDSARLHRPTIDGCYR